MSRLERLFTLLETGSNTSVRKAAAQQIGEVQRLFPHDLQSLLDNLQKYLASNKWDTRIAAGQAIEAIASNVPLWDAKAVLLEKEQEWKQELKQEHTTTLKDEKDNNNNNNNDISTIDNSSSSEIFGFKVEVKIEEEMATDALQKKIQQYYQQNIQNIATPEEFDLQFDSFDINKVLKNGAPLLSSGGSEYDEELKEKDMNLDPKELLERQRKRMRKKLGLEEMPISMGFAPDELLDVDDLIVKKESTQQQEKKDNISDVLDTSGMSKRERNLEKRKARNQQKEKQQDGNKRFKQVNGKEKAGTTANTKQHITEQAQNSDKIVMESVLDVEKAYNQDEWPFSSLYQDLILDLFNPNWEIRHGSAVGLREICRKHGGGGGITIYTPNEKMEIQNTLWLEDFAIRLLCVIALDRFCDYGSDQIVAPVRETCAQVLGLVVKYMNETSVVKVLQVLLQLNESKQWEVRHGALQGIKYVVVVRLDLVDTILPLVLDAITLGLMDRDDDVRATASETFQPLARHLVAPKYIGRLPSLLNILWDILLELDDLAVSTASVLNLLSDIYSFPEILPTIAANSSNIGTQNSSVLAHLVPRLYPFFRHNLYTVRQSAVKTVHRLIMSSSPETKTHWLLSILEQLLRYIFQNILLEDRDDIVDLSLLTWSELISSFNSSVIRGATLTFLGQWITLLATNPSSPLNIDLLLSTPSLRSKLEVTTPNQLRKRTAKQQQQEESVDSSSSSTTPINKDYHLSTRNKIIGIKSIGSLIRCWPIDCLGEIQEMFGQMIKSTGAIQKHLACLIMSESYYNNNNNNNSSSTSSFGLLNQSIETYLFESLELAEPNFYYYESDSVIRAKLLADSKILAKSYQGVGVVDFTQVQHIQQWIDENNNNLLISSETILPQSLSLVSEVHTYAIESIKVSFPPQQLPKLASILDQLEARRKTTMVTLGYIDKLQKEYHTMVQGAMSELLIASRSIPTKITPVIRSLLHSIRNQEDFTYQQRASSALASLTLLSVARKPCPNDKIIKSLFSILCDDRTDTPLALLPNKSNNLDETLEQQIFGNQQLMDQDEIKLLRLGKRGAVEFFKSLCNQFKSSLFESVPILYELISQPILQVYQETQGSGTFMDQLVTDYDRIQSVIDSLSLLRTVLPHIDKEISDHLRQLMPAVFYLVQFPNTPLQYTTSSCIATYCKSMTLDSMQMLISTTLPLLGDTKSLKNRFGAIQALVQVLREMNMEVVPYIVFLTIPILGCMSDPDLNLRKQASLCFARLVKLMPLESGVPDPEGLDPVLVEKKKKERKFLEQLLDGSKVESYPLPMRINTELRKYQQDGVNWLAFLNKYQLHGILCDDMGLGKTLQTICIVAGDDYDRAQQFKLHGTPNFQPLPSLVICPSTLVGHWVSEIKKFTDNEQMRPLAYYGPPNDRAALRQQFHKHNVLIMSYEVVRNDIEHLAALTFNYCILDEGHIIKNTKTKMTKAVKQINANHRLILSGTPIQNNVLELWSLFDFLMPGFLGTERQFEELYSKPILASKDPKCTAKDQEAGALAMEALHRQVLPFLLRRLKENVLADLPPKIIQDRYCKLSWLQQRLYSSFSHSSNRDEISNDLQDGDDGDDEGKSKKKSGKSANHIFQALQYLRKLCSHPKFVFNANHPQYQKIVDEMVQKRLPIDVHSIENAPKLTSLRELLWECGIGKDDDKENGLVKKEKDSLENLEISTQHRCLIFAQTKAMLDCVESDLLKKILPSVTYLRMDGGTEQMKRQTIVNRFNADPTIDLLLLTTTVGGLGLNLTGADTVIFLEHDWNPMKDLQAMDRAHRIGQKKVVNVYRLITQGTLEEKIMGLQKFKLNIANTIVNQENQSLQTMSTNELLNLFDYNEQEQQQQQQQDGAGIDSLTGEITNQAGQKKKSSTKQGGLQSVLDSLGELWDEKQYQEEFNINNFISQL
ncbi:SNF2-related domain-containing protein [Cavenderia fasciculata]|uniref:SNF2-related domain-containing protein n=1 Tax=Cavenderia fasciculata TaxID=261658 RepID=F4QAM7_CACFS|nr:SNF2-related domain-containing protein [Cavenderia fasciculata]EGG15746.1 SNF2-related domain-containing protein [Cavenderia fasciculata]|eukprot:XP_004354493.1 SNF2-related domain-containing protein [Cavenderia fasciculata]